VVLIPVVYALAGLLIGCWLNQVIARAPMKDPELRVGFFRRPLATLPRSAREWTVCVTTAVGFAAAADRFGSDWRLAPYLFGISSMVAVSFTDIDTMRIPDRLTFPSQAIVAALIAAVSLGLGDPGSIARAAIGAAAFSGFLGLLWFIYPKGMGFGDVKYAVVLGALVGWIDPLLVAWSVFGASVLGSVIGMIVVVKAHDRKKAFPFGPSLCLGSALAIEFSRHLLP
jgi:leader peptidase (prepilin peptidase) / N-methyltransferase